MAVIIPEKIYTKIDEATWNDLNRQLTIISISAKNLHCQDAAGKKIMILKNPPKIEFTGLTRLLGEPLDYSKVANDECVLNKKFDLRIPEAETEQCIQKLDKIDVEPIDDATATLKNNIFRTPNKKTSNGSKLPSEEEENRKKIVANMYAEAEKDDDYIPVNCLNTYIADWAIKVKVTKKYGIR